MSQQTETNSIHADDEINYTVSDNNIIEISFPTGYFGSRQTLQFLLCESCFWCASTSIVYFIKNPKCHICDGYRITLVTILKG
jgi:hypothetical protein